VRKEGSRRRTDFFSREQAKTVKMRKERLDHLSKKKKKASVRKGQDVHWGLGGVGVANAKPPVRESRRRRINTPRTKKAEGKMIRRKHFIFHEEKPISQRNTKKKNRKKEGRKKEETTGPLDLRREYQKRRGGGSGLGKKRLCNGGLSEGWRYAKNTPPQTKTEGNTNRKTKGNRGVMPRKERLVGIKQRWGPAQQAK